MKMIERRLMKGAEIRAKGDGHIEGHAAVFNQEYVMWDSDSYRVVEKVKRGAFTRAIKEKDDVRCLFNHDPDQVLGRTSSGTVKLRQDHVGLFFECAPPDTRPGRDVVALIKRGDLSGCSFSFVVSKETITEAKLGGKTVRTREIEEVDPLLDVGPVTWPAYTGTDVNVRAMEMREAMFPAGVPARLLQLMPQLCGSIEGQVQRDLAHVDRRLRSIKSVLDQDDQDVERVLAFDDRLRAAGVTPLY